MAQRIHIARHGFRLSWLTSSWKSVTGTPRDPPLAAYGEEQARYLANHLLSLPEHERPTVIFSSPYYRCLQTAVPLAAALDVPLHVEHGFSEWYNTVKPGTGMLPRPHPAKLLKSYFPIIDASHASLSFPSRKGETIEELHRRAEATLEALIRKHEGARMLIMTHAATAIALVRSLVKDRELPLRVGCCSLTVLDKQSDGSWKATGSMSDTSFLPNGSERDWGFEDVSFIDGRVVEDVGEGEPDTDDDNLDVMLPTAVPRL